MSAAIPNEMILASAGSGKTWQLTNRFIALMGQQLLAGQDVTPERIVAVTFTRKAAGEFFDSILVKLAKARPGQVNVAMSGSGSTGHVASVGFTRAAGIEVTYVPYKGNALALIDVMGGHVSVLFDQVSTSIPLIRSGKVRALGVTSTRRSVLLPDVPTIAESGLPGYEAATFNAVLAPAAVPAAIVSRMHGAIAAAVKQPDLRGRMAELGIELMANASPEEATAFVRSEVARMARLVKEAGIKAD